MNPRQNHGQRILPTWQRLSARKRLQLSRYQKGWHTSFANESVAVTRVTQEQRGFKLKRQDGTDIPAAQIREIEQGMDELESVVGPLGDVCRFADVTIAHTNGKMPFLKRAGGVFHPDEVTISIGVKDLRALAHELAHFLDFQAGHLHGKQTRRYSKSNPYAPARISTSLADADAHDRAYGTSSPGAELLREATRTISNTYVVERQMRGKLDDIATEEGKREVRRARAALGSYWREPCEVFARLVEQYIASELTGRGTPPTAAADADYDGRAGWWRDAQFEAWKPRIRAEIDRRLAIIRAQIAAQGPPQPMAKGTGSGVTERIDPASAAAAAADVAKARRPAPVVCKATPALSTRLRDLYRLRERVSRELFYLVDEDIPAAAPSLRGALDRARTDLERRKLELDVEIDRLHSQGRNAA